MNINKAFKNRFFISGIAVILILAIAGGAFYAGYKEGIKKPQTVLIRGVNNLEQGKEEGVDFGLFWDAWRIFKDKYVDADKINNQDLLYGAISGLLNTSKDQNTVFFPPTDAKKFGEDISGEFSGIGAEIGIRNDQLVIIAPLKDTPAEQAGLRSGDKILKIDKTDSFGLMVDEAVKLIRGERGTTVTLSILRNGWEKPREFRIRRDTIQIPTLDFEMRGDIAYIHLYNFYEKAPYLFYQTAIKIALQNPKGIVFDLRDNPGGYLEVAENLAGWFLKPGEIVVKEKFRSGNEEFFKASGSGLFRDIPIVVLINQGSASASEILAGALRDNRSSKLVGKKSFGKGTVQELQTLKDGSLLKITIAHWLTPNGQVIDKNGIAPDYDVDLSDDDVKAKRDPQLDKAMEIIRSEISETEFIPRFELQYQ